MKNMFLYSDSLVIIGLVYLVGMESPLCAALKDSGAMPKAESLEADLKHTHAGRVFLKFRTERTGSSAPSFPQVLTPPEKILDSSWSAFFKAGRSSWGNSERCVTDALEEAIEEQTKKKADDIVFLRKITGILNPLVKPFELNSFVVPSVKMILDSTTACGCCSGRYHVSLSKVPNTVQAELLPASQDSPCTVFLSGISVTGITVDRTDLSKLCSEKSIEEARGVRGLRRCIMVLFHELTHLARLDPLTRVLSGGTSLQKLRCSQACEFQADSLPLFILQNENYFSAAAEFFCIDLLHCWGEAAILKSKYLPEDPIVLQEAFAVVMKQMQEGLRSQYAIKESMTDAEKLDHMKGVVRPYYTQSQKTHPHSYMRVQKILSLWAAYLVHEKSFTCSDAVNRVRATLKSVIGSWKVSTQYADKEDIVYKVIDEWVARSLPVEQTSPEKTISL